MISLRKLGWWPYLAAAILAACSPGKSEVEDQVRNELKDPESARFGPDVLSHKGKFGSVSCGTVNAKNSFGGYVGSRTFMVYQGSVAFANSEEENEIMINCCEHVIDAAKADKDPWSAPGFSESCTGLPPTSWNFTKRL